MIQTLYPSRLSQENNSVIQKEKEIENSDGWKKINSWKSMREKGIAIENIKLLNRWKESEDRS